MRYAAGTVTRVPRAFFFCRVVAYASIFLNTTHVLWPPKPKAFESATVTSRSCGVLGV